MELLRFDSRQSNPRYNRPIELLKKYLAGVNVISATGRTFERAGARLPAFEPAGCSA